MFLLFLYIHIMKNHLFILLPFLLVLTACGNSEMPVRQILFKGGEEGYACFRIPAIIQTEKALLAFAEGRVNGCSDTGDIDLVMKRSNDGGETWSDLVVIWDAGEHVAGNPAPVYDAETKTVFLLSTWNLGTDHEPKIISGESEDTRRVFVLYSRDFGQTWSGAREITESTKLPDWTWYATGPVHGIQVQNGPYAGRLIIPCDHIESKTKHYYSHIIYSDDHGMTWELGGSTPQHQVNECTISELSEGRLLLNMRNYDRNFRARKISVSEDGGASWSDIRPDLALPEPICQGALLSIINEKPLPDLYFLNPASSSGREKMTLKISTDEGMTWADSLLLEPGPAAYSDLTLTSDGYLGCLYETGKEHPYEGIVFEVVDPLVFELKGNTGL